MESSDRGDEQILQGHLDGVNSVAISHDGQYVISVSYYELFCVWNAATGDIDRRLEGHSCKVSHSACSKDSKHVVSAGDDGSVRILNAVTGDIVHTSRPLGSCTFRCVLSLWDTRGVRFG